MCLKNKSQFFFHYIITPPHFEPASTEPASKISSKIPHVQVLFLMNSSSKMAYALLICSVKYRTQLHKMYLTLTNS